MIYSQNLLKLVISLAKNFHSVPCIPGLYVCLRCVDLNFNGVLLYFLGIQCAIDVAAELRIKYTIPKVCTAHAQAFAAYLQYELVVPTIFGLAVVYLVALYVDTVFHDL